MAYSNSQPSGWQQKNSKQPVVHEKSTQDFQRDFDLQPRRDHAILFNAAEFEHHKIFRPFPEMYEEDKWDNLHVRMPYSKSNLMAAQSKLSYWHDHESRWKKIEEQLQFRITNVDELKKAIVSYNPDYWGICSFSSLELLISQMQQDEFDTFFESTLPKMQSLVMELPYNCTKPIPLLKRGKNGKITMSQHQASSLLANAFFCTFPVRHSQYMSEPDINFIRLFGDSHHGTQRKVEKLKCIVHYFEKIPDDRQDQNIGSITFTRRCLDKSQFPNWKASTTEFTKLTVENLGLIEDSGEGNLKVDFANKHVGGGVLGNGLAQEEILFLICPEMILSRLFTETLGDNEVLIMTGCERFSKYDGYGDYFRYDGNYDDKTPRDKWGRKTSEVVAMDALCFHSHDAQYQEQKILRELQKAYCAFMGSGTDTKLPPVCTGKWGCGAFGGDLQLKALIQMCAASEAGRDVIFKTIGDTEFGNKLSEVYRTLQHYKISTSTVLEMINKYSEKYKNSFFGKLQRPWRKPCPSLFEFILTKARKWVSSSTDKYHTNPWTIDYNSRSSDVFSSYPSVAYLEMEYLGGNV